MSTHERSHCTIIRQAERNRLHYGARRVLVHKAQTRCRPCSISRKSPSQTKAFHSFQCREKKNSRWDAKENTEIVVLTGCKRVRAVGVGECMNEKGNCLTRCCELRRLSGNAVYAYLFIERSGQWCVCSCGVLLRAIM